MDFSFFNNDNDTTQFFIRHYNDNGTISSIEIKSIHIFKDVFRFVIVHQEQSSRDRLF